MPRSHRGSIYFITLLSIVAITSMVLMGLALRKSSDSRIRLSTSGINTSNEINNAAQYALAVIGADPQWRYTAQSGTVFSGMQLDQSLADCSVVDTSTGTLPTFDTTAYRLTFQSKYHQAKLGTQVDLDAAFAVDYASLVSTSYNGKRYWPLTEHNNPTTAQEVLKGHNGNYLNASIAGTAINEEGGPVPLFANANDHVVIPYPSDITQPNGSISLWMNCSDTNSSNVNSIFGMLYAADKGPTINLSVWKNDLVGYVNSSGTYDFFDFVLSSSNQISPNTWYHIVMTWGDNGLRLYINGVEVGKNKNNTDSPNIKSKNNNRPSVDFLLGAGYSMISPLSQPQVGFRGSICHVVLYDTQLTASEVDALAKIKPDLRTYSLAKDSWVWLYNQ